MPRKDRKPAPPVLWERVGKYTNRMKVPNGWLVKTTQMFKNTVPTTNLIFVEDPEHEWVPEAPEKGEMAPAEEEGDYDT